MTHHITLQSAVQLTHDTRHYVFTRPPNYSFTPGQATDMALDQDGWRDETRPFTFTGHPDANILSFVIKGYPSHDGVTARLGRLSPGEKVFIGAAWGAIRDHGPGVFIAGGAGITPFLGVLDARARAGNLNRCALLYSNKTERDIILRPFFEGLSDLQTEFMVSNPARADTPKRRLNGATLDGIISDWDQRFYVCGPPSLEKDVIAHLKGRGVADDRIIREA